MFLTRPFTNRPFCTYITDPGLNAINLGRIAAVEIYGTIKRAPPIDGCSDVKGAKFEKDFQENIEFKNVVFAKHLGFFVFGMLIPSIESFSGKELDN